MTQQAIPGILVIGSDLKRTHHVLIRMGYHTGQIMVVLVLSSPILPSKNNFVKALRKVHPEITTVVVNVNDRRTSMVLGDKEQVIYGKGYIEDVLCDKTFRISPKSFYQVNPRQTEILYRTAIEMAGLKGTETVLDAYCGTGTIGIIASAHAKNVIGVELNADAVRDAKVNAKCNQVKNIQFYQNDAGKFLEEMAEQKAKLDLLLMDPPRSGSDEKFLASVVKIAPEKIVYISCNPETLVRDLKYLQKHGYKAKKAVGVDMFPWTEHVETVCLLSKGDVKSQKLRVEFSLEDMDTDGFKQGATYNAIRDWIKAKYGYRVTNLNIAQVKQKHGIIERENYNKPKSPDSRQPGCPEEKVKAIEDAMRHFQMI